MGAENGVEYPSEEHTLQLEGVEWSERLDEASELSPRFSRVR